MPRLDAAFLLMLSLTLSASGPVLAGDGSVQRCTSLLYLGAMALAQADVCGTSKGEAAPFKEQYDRECAGLFDARQEGIVFDQALVDARSDYSKRGRARFCSRQGAAAPGITARVWGPR